MSALATAASGAGRPITGFTPETESVVALTVAHLDHDPANNADDNLAALCQACHNRCDAPKRAQNRRHNALRDAGQLSLI